MIWKMTSHFQNLMVLICLQVAVPQKYIQALVGFQVFMFDFSPLVPFLDDYFELLHDSFDINYTVLEKFNDTGFDYFSVLVNYNFTILIGFLGAIFHLIFTWIYKHTDKRMLTWCQKLIVRIYEHMTYGWYFRFVFEMALFLMMNSLIELISMIMVLNRHQRFSRPLISNLFALLMIFLYTWMIWLLISKLKLKLRTLSKKMTMKAISNLNHKQNQIERSNDSNNEKQMRYFFLNFSYLYYNTNNW